MFRVTSKNTYSYRRSLKAVGARWNKATKEWRITADMVNAVRDLGLDVAPITASPANGETPTPRHKSPRRNPVAPKKLKVIGNAPHMQEFVTRMSEPTQLWSFWSDAETLAAHVLANAEKAWKDGPTTINNDDFYGTQTLSDAVQLAKTGWPEGATRAAYLRDRIVANSPMARSLTRYGMAGARPSVPRYLAGNPAHMVQYEPAKSRARPVITLINDLSTQAIVEAKALFNRACVVAAIIDVIEAAGFSCGVVSKYETVTPRAAYHFHSVVVKEPDQPADIGRLAFSGHPAMLRRLLFGAATTDKHIQSIGHGLGTPGSVPRHDLPANCYLLEPVTMNNNTLFDHEDAASTVGLEYLLNSLRKQHCPAIPQEISDAA